jgi:predicted DsbA family dithiol-disulfide isomerase
MPVEGMDRKTYRSLKFGSWARSQALDAQTVAAARDDDVAFAYDAIGRTPNTLLTHRLASFAGRHGVQYAVVDAVLSGYFERGQDIGRIETLADLAAVAGLDRREVVGFLESEAGTDEVRALERAAAGVRSVPHFDIDGEIVTGAQAAYLLLAAIMAAYAGRRGIDPAARTSTAGGGA